MSGLTCGLACSTVTGPCHAATSAPRQGGKMSQHMDSLSMGDSIEVRGPFGEFTYLGSGRFRWVVPRALLLAGWIIRVGVHSQCGCCCWLVS